MKVAQIFRFPIKGLPGEEIESAQVSSGSGIEGDRRVAFGNGTADHQDERWDSCLGFTILKNDKSLQKWSVQSQPPLITLTAPEALGAEPLTFNAEVEAERQLAGEYLASRLPSQGNRPRQLVSATQGMFDSQRSGISIINPNTVEVLSQASGVQLDPRRYRGNLLVEDLPAFAEFGLIGKVLQIGSVRMVITKSIARCSATSVNPDTTEVDTNGPRLLATHFGHIHCGVYGTVIDSGTLAVGDSLRVVDRTESPDLVPVKASPRFMTVERKEFLTDDVVELTLRDPHAWISEKYEAGGHLRVHLSEPLWRNYTITSVNQADITIAVRVQGDVSRKIAQIAEGQQILVSGPYGTLTASKVLSERTAIVTAGIGITPALGLLSDTGTFNKADALRIVHVERGEASHLYSKLEDLAAELEIPVNLKRCDSMLARLEVIDIAKELEGCTSVLTCGPQTFTDAVVEACQIAGVDASQVYRETFVSPTTDLDRLFVGYPKAKVACAGSQQEFIWEPSAGVLLEALEERGVLAKSQCRAGSCGECALKLIKGRVSYPLEPSARVEPDQILACMAVPAGDIELDI